MVEDYCTGKAYILIHRVELHDEQHDGIAYYAYVIHDGSKISPERKNDAVYIEHITHKDRYSCKKKAHTKSEHKQTQV